MRKRTFKKWKVSQEELPNFIEKLIDTQFEVVDRQPQQGDIVFPNQFWVWKTTTNIHIVGRCLFSTDMYEYIINDRGEDKFDADVRAAYKQFKCYIDKEYEIEELQEYKMFTSKAFTYQNEEYFGKEVEAYGYDMNKCYLAALKEQVPITQEMDVMRVVEEGEVGFTVDFGDVVLHKNKETGLNEVRNPMRRVEVGEFAEYVFPLTKSPFLRYVEYMEKAIAKAKAKGDKDEESRLKSNIVCSVGNLQNHNPFLRAHIVELMNKKMMALMDENTLYCNTDSIVSLTRRDDLPISDNVGDFKVEHHGKFTHFGVDYTWDDGKETHRGENKNPIKWVYKIRDGRLYIEENK